MFYAIPKARVIYKARTSLDVSVLDMNMFGVVLDSRGSMNGINFAVLLPLVNPAPTGNQPPTQLA